MKKKEGRSMEATRTVRRQLLGDDPTGTQNERRKKRTPTGNKTAGGGTVVGGAVFGFVLVFGQQRLDGRGQGENTLDEANTVFDVLGSKMSKVFIRGGRCC